MSRELPKPLLEKNKPQQARAIETYERILRAAAELLEERGVDSISTNNIAERAAITVPALYRYFPNKYAVLYTLGARLMDKQNQVLVAWSNRYFAPDDANALIDNLRELLQETLEVTLNGPAGLALLRALRALPVMQDVLLESHYAMSQWATENWAQPLKLDTDPDNLRRMRLILQMGTSAIELALEDPDMPIDFALNEATDMLQMYWRKILL
ncbi:helix-turn-helix domain-containing protein [Simiduia curdlanivorans]|uniref:TetR/AcrR family transcriptional regulator n=1 Tax=Simiduia curdlanivorans TaxID=1492769 RepID=A0ABV8V849_9GAMM|nr:TetR/AcrR family transcriptional regulator [Simiduia curdlanivorans]MDN3639025.1 helix-turn-helix domain-containing protein [Simiduia curdlanivorans]